MASRTSAVTAKLWIANATAREGTRRFESRRDFDRNAHRCPVPLLLRLLESHSNNIFHSEWISQRPRQSGFVRNARREFLHLLNPTSRDHYFPRLSSFNASCIRLVIQIIENREKIRVFECKQIVGLEISIFFCKSKGRWWEICI